MSSEVVREVLSMGFDPQLVRTTLQQLMSSSGLFGPMVSAAYVKCAALGSLCLRERGPRGMMQAGLRT